MATKRDGEMHDNSSNPPSDGDPNDSGFLEDPDTGLTDFSNLLSVKKKTAADKLAKNLDATLKRSNDLLAQILNKPGSSGMPKRAKIMGK